MIPQRNGHVILFSGSTNDGAAGALETALHKTPNATTVVFYSEGGWLHGGTLVVNVIRRHHLRTYVERACALAYTITLLAGEDHAAVPGARLGSHRPRAVGAEHSQSPDTTDSELWRVYSDAGLPDAFVRRVQGTSFNQMWLPAA